MQLDQPWSTGECSSGQCSATLALELDECFPAKVSCPAAPRKVHRWQFEAVFLDSLQKSVTDICELLSVLDAEKRCGIIPHLPVYTLEDLFLTYCLWYSGTHPRPFDCLLQQAPDLDEQLVSYALTGGGGGVSQCTWEQWEALLLRAAADPAGAGRQAARALFGQQAGAISSSSSPDGNSSSKPPCYRVLSF